VIYSRIGVLIQHCSDWKQLVSENPQTLEGDDNEEIGE
jgi:hypothetical protein